MQQVLQLMALLFRSPLAQVVQVVRHRALVELMQVTESLLLFQAVELQRGLQLAAVLVDMAQVRVLLVVLVVAVVTEEQVDLQLHFKATLEPLAYQITQVTGWAAAAAVLEERPQHQVLQKQARAELVLKSPGFQQRLDRH
jgi:hypothetical protein